MAKLIRKSGLSSVVEKEKKKRETQVGRRIREAVDMKPRRQEERFRDRAAPTLATSRPAPSYQVEELQESLVARTPTIMDETGVSRLTKLDDWSNATRTVPEIVSDRGATIRHRLSRATWRPSNGEQGLDSMKLAAQKVASLSMRLFPNSNDSQRFIELVQSGASGLFDDCILESPGSLVELNTYANISRTAWGQSWPDFHSPIMKQLWPVVIILARSGLSKDKVHRAVIGACQLLEGYSPSQAAAVFVRTVFDYAMIELHCEIAKEMEVQSPKDAERITDKEDRANK